MRKIYVLSVVLLVFVFLPTSCSGGDDVVVDLGQRFQNDPTPPYPATPFVLPDASEISNVIEVGERFFVNQILEIFLNHRQYLGRFVQYEGMFHTVPWDGYDFYIVYRYTFHCCGELDRVGFEVILDDVDPLPDDTWVEVLGMVDTVDGFLVLRVISITEMDQRGAEFVS